MPLYVNRVGLIQGRNGELKVLNSLTKQADMGSPSVMFTVQITDIQSGNKRNLELLSRVHTSEKKRLRGDVYVRVQSKSFPDRYPRDPPREEKTEQ